MLKHQHPEKQTARLALLPTHNFFNCIGAKRTMNAVSDKLSGNPGDRNRRKLPGFFEKIELDANTTAKAVWEFVCNLKAGSWAVLKEDNIEKLTVTNHDTGLNEVITADKVKDDSPEIPITIPETGHNKLIVTWHA
ncbi:hypothetical protein Ddc_13978 [Ditylenchus destructor]|nr:hypothetical protein Ddc_13978 [Ditylenchus destructor]